MAQKRREGEDEGLLFMRGLGGRASTKDEDAAVGIYNCLTVIGHQFTNVRGCKFTGSIPVWSESLSFFSERGVVGADEFMSSHHHLNSLFSETKSSLVFERSHLNPKKSIDKLGLNLQLYTNDWNTSLLHCTSQPGKEFNRVVYRPISLGGDLRHPPKGDPRPPDVPVKRHLTSMNSISYRTKNVHWERPFLMTSFCPTFQCTKVIFLWIPTGHSICQRSRYINYVNNVRAIRIAHYEICFVRTKNKCIIETIFSSRLRRRLLKLYEK